VANKKRPLHRVYNGEMFMGLVRAVHGLAAIRAVERRLGFYLARGYADEVAGVPTKPAKPNDLLHYLPPSQALCPNCGYRDPSPMADACPSCGTPC